MSKYDELVSLLDKVGVLILDEPWAIEIQNLIDRHTANDCEDVWFKEDNTQIQRDERAEFEKVFVEKMGTLPLLKNDSLIRYRGGMYVSDKALLAEIFWMARAALDKVTEGENHE